jgi:hypothetical protein
MRIRFVALVASAAALVLASCHASPDIRDVTRIDTVEIIRNVRCEAKDALAAYPPSHWVHRAAIAYGFNFDAIERNGLAAGLTFGFPITNGRWVLGVDGGVAKHRQGTNVVDIGEVLGNLSRLDCINRPTPSIAYPITGRIGVAEVIQSFVAVGSMDGVAQKSFTRTVRYELRLNAGVRPTISVLPAPGNPRDANLNLSANREDIHRLLLSLEPPRGGLPTRRGLVGGAPGSVERALRNIDIQRSLRNEELILERLGP